MWLMVVPVCVAGDKVKQSLDDLRSTDDGRYEKARNYLTSHVGIARSELQALVESHDGSLAELRAVMILGDTKDTGSIDVLRSALVGGREKNARVRGEIVHSLAAMGQQNSIISYFESGSEDSPLVKAQIALALRNRGDDKAKFVLSRLVTDDEYVFKAAAIAIQENYDRLSSAGKGSRFKISVGNPAGTSGVSKTDTLALHGQPDSGGKFLQANDADLALIEALKVQEKNPNRVISDTAKQLLEDLTELYGKSK